jgi:branched-chain amino acid transport system permease protein
MRNFLHDRRALFALILLAALALVPVAAQLLDQPFYIGQFRRILIFAIAALSLDLILGYGGMVSLGHAAFFGIGAYVVAILNYHAVQETLLFGILPGTRNPLITWPAAILISGGMAALIGLICLRTSGIYFIMITLAFAQMIYFFFVSLRAYGGDDGLRFTGEIAAIDWATRALTDDGGPFKDAEAVFETIFYYLVFAILAAALYASHRLTRARFGMVIQGCRENERRMRAIGFATFRYKLACFALAGALAGFAGALFAAHESYISPSIMHWTRSGDLIIMVVLGGMGTLIGPVAGSTLFLLLEKFLPDYTEHWPIVFGPILLLVVLFAKRGLYGSLSGRKVQHGEG